MPSALTNFSGQAPGARTVIPETMSLAFGGFARNKIINGDFTVSQRGVSFTTPNNGVYTVDRWIVTYDGTIGAFTISRPSFTVGQTDVPDEPWQYFRWNQTAAGSGSSFRRLAQRVENSRTLAGKTATLTFYAKADSARNIDASIIQNFGVSTAVAVAVGTFGLTTAWQKFTTSVAIPSISGKTLAAASWLEVRFDLPINSTMIIDFSHIQLEENGATSFEQRSIGDEMELCQRFYQVIPMAIGSSTTTIPFKSPMRTQPAVFTGGGAGFTTSNMDSNGHGGCAYQTTPAEITLTMESEL